MLEGTSDGVLNSYLCPSVATKDMSAMRKHVTEIDFYSSAPGSESHFGGKNDWGLWCETATFTNHLVYHINPIQMNIDDCYVWHRGRIDVVVLELSLYHSKVPS